MWKNVLTCTDRWAEAIGIRPRFFLKQRQTACAHLQHLCPLLVRHKRNREERAAINTKIIIYGLNIFTQFTVKTGKKIHTTSSSIGNCGAAVMAATSTLRIRSWKQKRDAQTQKPESTIKITFCFQIRRKNDLNNRLNLGHNQGLQLVENITLLITRQCYFVWRRLSPFSDSGRCTHSFVSLYQMHTSMTRITLHWTVNIDYNKWKVNN